MTRRSALSFVVGAGAGLMVRALPFAESAAIPAISASAAPAADTVVCNGFTVEAIEGALATAGPFGDVLLPSGTYSIDRTITIPSDGLSIRGTGSDTVLQARDESFNVLYLHDRSNVSIRDLKIVGAGRDGAGGIGLLADSCTGCLFEGLLVESCGSSDASGIHLRSTSFSHIANSSFVGNGRGIHVYSNSTYNVISACNGRGNAKEMIFLTEGCTDCTLADCVSDGDGMRGAAVSIALHQSDRSIITGSSILRSGHEQGVEIAAGNDNVVANCTIADSNWAGLHIVNSQRARIVGNTITGNQQAGILLRSAGDPSESRPSDGCQIIGNLIADNNPTGRPLQEAGWSGVEIESGSSVQIERNVFRDNASAAIHIAAGNRGTLIRGNVFQGGHAALLVDNGSQTDADVAPA